MRRIVFAFFAASLLLAVMNGLGRHDAWAEGPATAVKQPAARSGHKEPTAALFFAGRLAGIGLGKEQKEKIRAVFAAHEGALASATARYVEKRRQLRTLIDDSGADEDAIAAVAREIGEMEAELAVGRNRVLKEVVNLLTPEQAVKFKKGRLPGQRREGGQPR